MQAFAIIATPRSASTMLCGLLASHPEVHCHYEAFHPLYVDIRVNDDQDPILFTDARDADQAAFVPRLLEHTQGEHPEAKAIGFKIMLSPLQMGAGYRAVIADRRIRKILLDRPNRFEGYRSWKQSMHSGQWRVDQADKVISFPLTFDRTEFLKYMREANEFLADARQRMVGQDVLVLRYDDVVRGDGVARVLSLLNLPTANLVNPWQPMNLRPTLESFVNPVDALETLREINHMEWCPLVEKNEMM